jgi:hypothetical protein
MDMGPIVEKGRSPGVSGKFAYRQLGKILAHTLNFSDAGNHGAEGLVMGRTIENRLSSV